MDVKVCEEVGINNLYEELKKTQEEYEELGMRYLELEEKVDSFSCL